MATSLYKFYSHIDNRLKKTFMSFVARCGSLKAPKEIYQEVDRRQKRPKNDAETDKPKSLGYYFEVLAVAIESCQCSGFGDLTRNWNDVVQIRNKVAHGDTEDFLVNWAEPLRITIRNMPRLSTLLKVVAAVCDEGQTLKELTDGNAVGKTSANA